MRRHSGKKEKTTLYTRNAIIEALQETLPELVSAAINAYHILHNEALEEVEVNIKFKEYAIHHLKARLRR